MIYLYFIYKGDSFICSDKLSAVSEKRAFDWLEEYYGKDCNIVLQFWTTWEDKDIKD